MTPLLFAAIVLTALASWYALWHALGVNLNAIREVAQLLPNAHGTPVVSDRWLNDWRTFAGGRASAIAYVLNDETPYRAGDVVMHGDALYRVMLAHWHDRNSDGHYLIIMRLQVAKQEEAERADSDVDFS